MHTPTYSIKAWARPHLTMENAVLIVALLIAMSLLWNTMEALQRNYQLQRQVDIMKQETELYELENQTLDFQKDYFESAEYIELSARQRLNKAAPGEKLLILPAVPERPLETKPLPALRDDRSNFEQWIHFFFGSRPE